jgi:hypothetical protein
MSWNATRIDHLSISPRVPNPVRGKPFKRAGMYFQPLDSILDRARVPLKFPLVFQRPEENISPARRPWPTSRLFCSR